MAAPPWRRPMGPLCLCLFFLPPTPSFILVPSCNNPNPDLPDPHPPFLFPEATVSSLQSQQPRHQPAGDSPRETKEAGESQARPVYWEVKLYWGQVPCLPSASGVDLKDYCFLYILINAGNEYSSNYSLTSFPASNHTETFSYFKALGLIWADSELAHLSKPDHLAISTLMDSHTFQACDQASLLHVS